MNIITASFVFVWISVVSNIAIADESLPTTPIMTADIELDTAAERYIAAAGKAPSAPENVSLVRYSKVAAELFWDPPAASLNIIATEIYRDGTKIATVKGTSYYEDMLLVGPVDEFRLVAINRAGIRSIPAIFKVPGDVEPAAFAVNEGNLDDFIDNVARIVSGRVFKGMPSSAQQIAELPSEDIELMPSWRTSPESTVYVCEGGGTLYYSGIESGESYEWYREEQYKLKGCLLDSTKFHGQLFRVYDASIFTGTLSMDKFAGSYANGDASTISGTLVHEYPTAFTYLTTLTVDQYLESNTDGSERPVTDYIRDSSVFYDDFDFDNDGNTSETTHALDSSWTASGPFSNNLSVTAETTIPFCVDYVSDFNVSEFYTSGTLEMDIEGLLQVTLEANNGDPGTFQVTVVQGGAVQSYTVAWDADNRF